MMDLDIPERLVPIRDKIDKLKIAFSALQEKVKDVFKEQNMKTTGAPTADPK